MAFSGMKNDGSLTQSIYAVRRQHRGALGAATPPLRWKENLRRACLDRARQKRRDLVMRKRQLSGAHLDSAVMPAQNVVEEELRKLGVSIVSSSPLEDVHSDTAPFGISDKLPRRIVSRGAEAFLGEGGHGAGDYMEMEEDDSDSVGYVITEDDLQRIIRDVEEELCQNEELLLEEVLEAEEAEGNYLQDQIADYEAWEESTFRPTTSIDSVLCPICQCSYLVAIGNNISCSDSCSFRIDVASPDRPLCLLREDLSQVYKEHSGCSCNLSFEVIKSKTLRNQLFVCCHLCGLAKSFEY